MLQSTREEEGVGILSGAYLGGTRGATPDAKQWPRQRINALGGLPMAYRIPFLMLITPRGLLVLSSTRARVPAGRAVPKVLGRTRHRKRSPWTAWTKSR